MVKKKKKVKVVGSVAMESVDTGVSVDDVIEAAAEAVESVLIPVKKVVPSPIAAEGLSGYGLCGIIVKWEGITEHSVIEGFCVAGYENKSIQISGEMGGGSFDIVGKNDPCGKEEALLLDGDNEPLAAMGKKEIRSVSTHCYCLKPVRNGGAGMNADITMALYNRSR